MPAEAMEEPGSVAEAVAALAVDALGAEAAEPVAAVTQWCLLAGADHFSNMTCEA